MNKPPKPSLLPLLLPALLSACASGSPLSKPTPQPAIPPLPAQARQTDSPIFSANALNDIEQWQLRLIEPSLQDTPAKPATKR